MVPRDDSLRLLTFLAFQLRLFTAGTDTLLEPPITRFDKASRKASLEDRKKPRSQLKTAQNLSH